MTLLNSGYQIIRKGTGLIGLDLTIKRKPKPAGPGFLPSKKFEKVNTNACYAPWNLDKEFQRVHAEVKDNILVDIYRCHELWELTFESKKLSGAILEVGVWRGGTGAIIATAAKACGIKDNVYLADTFTGVAKAGKKDTLYKGDEHNDTSKRFVAKLMKRLHLDNTVILEGIFPEETAHLIKEKQFRLCHVDVDVYQSAKDVVEWVFPLMPIGGIIVFDDYGFRTAEGVTTFVNECRKKKDRIVIYNLNGHAIFIKTA